MYPRCKVGLSSLSHPEYILMKIISLLAFFWLSSGFAVYRLLPGWTLVVYGCLSALYLATWLILRRGFYPAE